MTLRARKLGRRFGEKVVFRDLDFEASRGECLAVTGPNGAGKTTLLRVLATALAPSDGEAWLDDEPFSEASSTLRRRIAWVPATEGGFVPRLTGRENLTLFASLRGIDAREMAPRLAPLAALAPLSGALRTPYYLCSAGMRQALHFARAAIVRPALLLLDEPTRSLDTDTASALRHIVRELAREAIVIFSNHHDRDLLLLADRTISLEPSA